MVVGIWMRDPLELFVAQQDHDFGLFTKLLGFVELNVQVEFSQGFR